MGPRPTASGLSDPARFQPGVGLRNAPDCHTRKGFTLLELLTVIVIVFILLTMLMPAFKHLLGRAERQNCVGNLKSLYTAAASYVQDQGQWPQIPPQNVQRPEYARAWVASFQAYGIGAKNWVCPSVQRQLGNPDVTLPENARVDYLATPFGPEPRAAFKWTSQPWFVERGDMHGDGQMVIFTNAEVKSLKDIFSSPTLQSVDNYP